VFLCWLLIRRLALGLPTALQLDNPYALIFHQGGVSKFGNPSDPLAYHALAFPYGEHPKRIWALIDTDSWRREPADVFNCDGPFFVVNTTMFISTTLDGLASTALKTST
jgi:hypothetical protein